MVKLGHFVSQWRVSVTTPYCFEPGQPLPTKTFEVRTVSGQIHPISRFPASGAVVDRGCVPISRSYLRVQGLRSIRYVTV